MIFRVAVGDEGRSLAPHPSALGAAVLPRETDGGGVIVQLVAADLEALRDGDHHFGEQGRAVRIEEPVQRSADAVVAHLIHPLRVQGIHLRRKRAHGLLLAIDRLPLHQDRAQQHAEP